MALSRGGARPHELRPRQGADHRRGGIGLSTEPGALRNRLVIATSIWREATDEPLPKLEPGEPAAQIQEFEIRVVDLLCGAATRETAKRIADQTWDLVQDRADGDPVKQRVVDCHEHLAKLSAGGG